MDIKFEDTPLSNINSAKWQKALEKASSDSSVGITHASILGNEDYRIHVAQITNRVGCHFHLSGDEDYKIVSGKGVLHWGPVTSNGIEWEDSLSVEVGDDFIIPEGCAHQLCREGSEDLIILFGCSDSHLDNDVDRFMLEDSPFL